MMFGADLRRANCRKCENIRSKMDFSCKAIKLVYASFRIVTAVAARIRWHVQAPRKLILRI